MDKRDDHRLAAAIASEAGEALVELRERLFADGQMSWQVGDMGDQAAHELIFKRLREARPDDGLLSEEEVEQARPKRLDRERVWIIDPLDGTREFGARGRSDWAVHVALVTNGAPTAGAVALPALGKTFATQPAPPLPNPTEGPPRLITSRSFVPAAAVVVARALGADVATLGSAGAKAMAVVQGLADVYVHSGGLYEWDSCAPAAVAAAAGLHTSRIDGSPLVYNGGDAWLPDLVICRPELADDVVGALRRAIAAS